MVTGGVDSGSRPAPYWAPQSPGSTGSATANGPAPVGDHRSYASTFIFDPRLENPTWSRAASLRTARTAPAAAVLADGRVLVAGGYYLGKAAGARDAAPTVVLAAYRAESSTGPAPVGPVLDDSGPSPSIVPAMATAELYDPATDSWSATGPMRYARVGAQAATLADGRVLVVGSSRDDGSYEPKWNFSQVEVAEQARTTGEIYDPKTGRFTLTGSLAEIDWSPLAQLGLSEFNTYPWGDGTLVALQDGGALLVGLTAMWDATGSDPDPDVYAGLSGMIVRTLRLDPRSARWTEIDRSLVIDASESPALPAGQVSAGHVSNRALVASLADGRVLVAGGEHLIGPDWYVATDKAWLYDPDTDAWTALPPMPEHRAGGTAVALPDASALLVGGQYEVASTGSWYAACTDGPPGLASTVRFVPGP
jgi:hypothetical protein